MKSTEIREALVKQSGIALSAALLVIAALLIVIALLPDEHLAKAIILAWIILP